MIIHSVLTGSINAIAAANAATVPVTNLETPTNSLALNKASNAKVYSLESLRQRRRVEGESRYSYFDLISELDGAVHTPIGTRKAQQIRKALRTVHQQITQRRNWAGVHRSMELAQAHPHLEESIFEELLEPLYQTHRQHPIFRQCLHDTAFANWLDLREILQGPASPQAWTQLVHALLPNRGAALDRALRYVHFRLPQWSKSYRFGKSAIDLSGLPLTAAHMPNLAHMLWATRSPQVFLNNCDLSDEAATLLIQHLAAIPQEKAAPLTAIYLKQNRIGPEKMPDLMKALENTPIKELYLAENPLGVEGVKHIAKYLPNSHLETLDLSQTGGGDLGAQLLAYAMMGFHRLPLRQLMYRDNDITAVGHWHLEGAQRRHRDIEFGQRYRAPRRSLTRLKTINPKHKSA